MWLLTLVAIVFLAVVVGFPAAAVRQVEVSTARALLDHDEAALFPIWTSEVEPGSTHDITAARLHVLGALYPTAAQGLPALTDKG